MKRILMVVMLVLGVSVFGLDHGLISGFELNYNIFDRINLQDDTENIYHEYDNSISILLTTGYRFDNLRIIGVYESTLNTISPDRYNPLQDLFSIDINYTFNNIKFGISHDCSHTSIVSTDDRTIFKDIVERKLYISFYQEF